MVKSKLLLLVPLCLLLQERKDSHSLSQCPAPTNAMLLALLRLCRLLRRLKTPETTRRQGVRLGTTTTTAVTFAVTNGVSVSVTVTDAVTATATASTTRYTVRERPWTLSPILVPMLGC